MVPRASQVGLEAMEQRGRGLLPAAQIAIMVETEATEVPAATVGREARQPRWFSRLEREAFSPTELRVFLPAYGLPMRDRKSVV